MSHSGFEILVGDPVVSADGRRWRILAVKRGLDPHFIAGDERGTTVLTGRLDQLEWSAGIGGWIMNGVPHY